MGYLNYGVLIELTDPDNFNYRLAARQNTQMFRSLGKKDQEKLRVFGYKNKGRDNIFNSRILLKQCIDGKLQNIPTPAESVKNITRLEEKQTTIQEIQVSVEIPQDKEVSTKPQKELQAMEKAYKKLKKEHDKLFTKNLSLENAMEKVINKNKELIQERKDFMGKIEELEDQLVEKDTIINQLKSENNSQRIAIGQLKKYFGKPSDTWAEVAKISTQQTPIIENMEIPKLKYSEAPEPKPVDDVFEPQEIKEESTSPEVQVDQSINLPEVMRSVIRKSRTKEQMDIEKLHMAIAQKYPEVTFVQVLFKSKEHAGFDFNNGTVKLNKKHW